MRVRRSVNSNVSITQNNNESLANQEGLSLININDVVAITQIWVAKGGPNYGDVVNPESLRQIIKTVKSCNPKRIVVACR